MTTKMTVNGQTTCVIAGSENFEKFEHRHRLYVQYDYRTASGKLFTCVGVTLENCRERRDAWLKSNE